MSRPLEPSDHTPTSNDTELDAADSAQPGPVWRRRLADAWPYLRWPTYLGAGLFGLLIAGAIWLWVTTDLPAAAGGGESAVLLDRNGDELAVLARDGLRLEVTLDEMAAHVPAALVAAEDQRYYDHDGIDPIGIARAMWNNLTDDDLEGGSTITQQLVKNVYLNSDRTISRKFREAVLAVKLERSSDKDEILERYLNEVYFGRGAYGIEAAARTYFDTSAAELTPTQSALLVGILRSPESLDPREDPDAARERRNAVLDAMVGMGALDEAEAASAMDEPIEVLDEVSPTQYTAGVAPHFVEQVRAEIVDEFGERALYDQGLVIHTTLDIEDQKAAEAAVAANLDDPEDPQAAVVGIDRSGAVRAWVGSKDFDELQVDLVTGDGGSGRQPGSTFKPLVLAANLEAGLGAGQRFPAPPEITLDIAPEPWTVQNAGGAGYGALTLYEGTVNSVNTVYAQALAQVGPEAVADVAERLGVERELEAQPSIALGTEEVSPLELATVYSTLGRSGERIDPYRITKVETRDGDVLWEMDEPETEDVMEARVADTVSHVLQDVPKRGTATRAALDRPMAAKTGTTQRNADAWLAGYTPEYTAVVWMGYADGNREMDTVDGERVFGGSIPAQIWHDFMAKALEDVEPTEFPEPDQELLGDTTDEVTLAVTPPTVEPGSSVTIEGAGFEVCVNGWSAVVEGPTSPESDPDEERNAKEDGDTGEPPRQPFSTETPSDGGSTDSERSTTVEIPADAAYGTYSVTARCDSGVGPQRLGPGASFQVIDPDPDPTTTTTTEADEDTKKDKDEDRSSTTTTTTSSTTSTTAPPTTTTEPDEEAGGTSTTTAQA